MQIVRTTIDNLNLMKNKVSPTIKLNFHARLNYYISDWQHIVVEPNLGRLDGRGHFKTILISLRRRPLYKDIGNTQILTLIYMEYSFTK